jgi:cell wall-associated NlpC family hydrolase
LIYYANSYLGTPYRFGGKTEAGMDCSGFIGTLFGWMNMTMPRSSRDIAKEGESVNWDEVSKGDLIYFKRSTKSKDIGHVGLIVGVGENSIQMIHSSSSRGVVIEDIFSLDYYKKRFVTAKRLFFK